MFSYLSKIATDFNSKEEIKQTHTTIATLNFGQFKKRDKRQIKVITRCVSHFPGGRLIFIVNHLSTLSYQLCFVLVTFQISIKFLLLNFLQFYPCVEDLVRGKSSPKKPWEWSLIKLRLFYFFSVIQQSCSRAVKAWEACDSRVFWRSHNLFQWNHGFYWPRFREYADGGKNHKLQCNFFFIIVKSAVVGIIFEIHL